MMAWPACLARSGIGEGTSSRGVELGQVLQAKCETAHRYEKSQASGILRLWDAR
jgi:hypothetical protein